jgi:acetyltransferase-like isoleucine patch superfamily enzyme
VRVGRRPVKRREVRRARRKGRLVLADGATFGRPAQLDLWHDGRFSVGEGSVVGRNAFIVVAPGAHVEIGRGATLADGCRFGAHGVISVGADVRFDEEVVLLDFAHETEDVETPIGRQGIVPGTIRIEDGAYLGRCCAVLRDVTIGAGARVAPMSVVTRDVPPGAFVQGAPAKVVPPALARREGSTGS